MKCFKKNRKKKKNKKSFLSINSEIDVTTNENINVYIDQEFQTTTIKCKLNTILKDKNLANIFKQKVLIVNKAFAQAYFLLNLYVLKLLENGEMVNIDATTINRCANFIIPDSAAIRNKDNEFKKLENIYKNLYLKLNPPEVQTCKSINRPIEYLSNILMTNIKNHCFMHFVKYQHKYLYSIVAKKISNLHIKRGLIRTITNCTQYHINNYKNNDDLIILSKNIKNHENYNEIRKIIIDIIEEEKDKIPIELRNT